MVRRIGTLGGLLILLTCAAPPSGASPTSTQVPFRLADRYILVDVRIDGEHRAVFCVDTASSVTLVSGQLAGHLKLSTRSTRRVVTQTGVEAMPQGSLASLQPGPLRVTDLNVIVAKLSPLTSVAPEADGVIGQDVLGTTNFLVDYQRGVIEFDRGHRLRWALVGSTLPVVRVGRRLLVKVQRTATAEARAVPMLLALDSAASSVVIFHKDTEGEVALQLGGRTRTVWVHSVEGEQMAVKGVAEELTIGTHVLRRVPVTMLAMPEGWQDHGQHGLLPTTVFDSIYFDNKECAVILNPQFLERTLAIDDDEEAAAAEDRTGDKPTRRPPQL